MSCLVSIFVGIIIGVSVAIISLYFKRYVFEREKREKERQQQFNYYLENLERSHCHLNKQEIEKYTSDECGIIIIGLCTQNAKFWPVYIMNSENVKNDLYKILESKIDNNCLNSIPKFDLRFNHKLLDIRSKSLKARIREQKNLIKLLKPKCNLTPKV